MKIAPFVALVLAAAAVHAASASPGAIVNDAMQVELRDRTTVSYPDASAVFSIDPEIAEVALAGGRITVVGRGTGTTTVSVVTPTGVTSFSVAVVAPRPWLAAVADSPSRAWTAWQSSYESLTDRLTNSLELVDGNDHRTLRGYVVNMTRLDRDLADSDARTTIPALALEWRSRHDEVVVFDKLIEHSQLTLDGVTVRGLHVRTGGLELHAGVTSPLLYQNVFLSTQREVVLGASYELRAGRSAFTPSVYAYPSDPTTGGTKGAMGSLQYRYATGDDRLQLRSELGWGGELGAAGELTYRDDDQRAWITARHQPRGFAALGIGHPIGSTFDGLWSADPTDRVTLTATATAANYDLPEDHHQDVETGGGEVRYKLVPRLAVSGGATVGRFGGDPMQSSVRSLTVPIGVYLEEPEFGASAIYRYERNSARNRGGHGGRVSLHGHRDMLYASGFFDLQQDAATLELILRDEPALAQLLNEMGLTATSPEDLARLLRENATLSQLGYVEGAQLSFHPWRAQAGADIALLAHDASRQQLHLRALLDRTQAVGGVQNTRSLSLSYARRLGRSVDVTGMLSWWSRDGARMTTSSDTWSVAAGLRVRFDDAPRVAALRRGDVTGTVIDESRHFAPVAGIKVRLDGGRTTVSDAAGNFAFHDVPGGEHRVEAELPDGLYFSGPSRFTVAPGDSARFAVARASALLSGRVHDDQGAGIAGVTLILRGNGRGEFPVTTDSGGEFRFAVGDGDYVLDPVPESVPAGYDVTAVKSKVVQLDAKTPVTLEIVAPASRSIAGTVHDPAAATGAASVTLVELGRSGVVDDAGHYVFRGLAPGHYTVEATVGGKKISREVDLPAGPVAVRDIDFP